MKTYRNQKNISIFNQDRNLSLHCNRQIKEMKALLKEKQESLQKNNKNLQTYRQAVDEDERKSLQHGMTIAQRRKELSSLCAKARNDYSRKEIKRDFKAGLRVGTLIIIP